MNRSNVWTGLVVNDWWIRFLTFEDMGLEENEHFAYCMCLLCECNTSIKVNCLELTKCLNCENGKIKKDLRLRHIWDGMKRRCYNSEGTGYYNYGGRGIRICDEWLNSFLAFQDWATNNGYKEDLTIERIDNDGNYCPENCKWITRGEQQSNTRRSRFVTCNGETKTVAQWARYVGLSESIIRHRIDVGWDVVRVLTTPSQMSRK